MLLTLTTPLTRNPAVRRAQELLLALGYDLGPYKADGAYGNATNSAVRIFQQDYGLPITGDIDDRTMNALQISIEALRPNLPSSQVQLPFPLIDLTKDGILPCHYHPERSPIPAANFRGFTLHWTACLMGASLGAWNVCNAQTGIRRDGTIMMILPQALSGPPLPAYVSHGNGLNSATEGIEIEANGEGVIGNSHTWWKEGGGPYEATDAQIAAARAYLTMRCSALRAKGVNPTWIRAHRQSSDQRQCDPGERIWREVGLWAIANLGLDDGGRDWQTGTGLPLPKAWGDRYTAAF